MGVPYGEQSGNVRHDLVEIFEIEVDRSHDESGFAERKIESTNPDVGVRSRMLRTLPAHCKVAKRDVLQGLKSELFQCDVIAKLAIDLNGHFLLANNRGMDCISDGLVKLRADSGFDFGSSALNLNAKQIIDSLAAGRETSRRMLLPQLNGVWLAMDFSRLDVSQCREQGIIVVSLEHEAKCDRIALDALAQTFHFTVSELEIVQRMAKALCPKEIANDLSLSINTVRSHLRSIYAKMGVRGYNRSLQLILRLL